ncbi:LysE family translocator [Streptomyces sp. NBC_01381]|uniref:LysE family translocator n=1 Tax=Streptomyces sp. NBC_01381 TaxID=2903845 RepID=UPI00225B9986|nr:LysE family translocator [Streptomyces sp. NBC_01381]MCX4666393.1 LysE family translocator [Streptomyces sp. NBC_01381]
MTSLGAFVLASLILVAVPGPNLIYIVTRSVRDGRRAGIVSALGVETGTLLHVIAAVCGLATLITGHPLVFAVLRYAGAGYLAYLGIRALRRRPPAAADADADADADDSAEAADSAEATGRSARRRRLLRLYIDGVLINLLNPKVVLFFLAFLPQFLSTGLTPAETRTGMLLLGAVFLTVAFALDLCYALVGATLARRLRGTPRRDRGLSHLTGGIYLGLAALVFV